MLNLITTTNTATTINIAAEDMTEDFAMNSEFGIAVDYAHRRAGEAHYTTRYVFMAEDAEGRREADVWRLRDDEKMTAPVIEYAKGWAEDVKIDAVRITVCCMENDWRAARLLVGAYKAYEYTPEYETAENADTFGTIEDAAINDDNDNNDNNNDETATKSVIESKEERQARIMAEIYASNAAEEKRRIAAFKGKKLKGDAPVVIPNRAGFVRTEYTPEEFGKWFAICKAGEEVLPKWDFGKGLACAWNYDPDIPDTRYMYYISNVEPDDWMRFSTIARYFWKNKIAASGWGKVRGAFCSGVKNADELWNAEIMAVEEERADAATANGLNKTAAKIRKASEETPFMINPDDDDSDATASTYDKVSLIDDVRIGNANTAYVDAMERFHEEIKNAVYSKTTKEKILKVLHDQGNFKASLEDAMKVYDEIRKDGKTTTLRGLKKTLEFKAKTPSELKAEKAKKR